MVDLIQYCERLQSQNGWAEPWNAISNLAFVGAFAAIVIPRRFRVESKDRFLLVMPIVILITAIGSFAWHTFRNPFTLAMDLGPIALFLVLLLFYMARQRYSQRTALFIVALFLLAEILAWGLVPRGFMNQTFPYVVAWAAFVALLTRIPRVPSSGWFALLAFGGAIFFRSIDLAICEEMRVGTHFIWHGLAALSTYLGYRAAVQLRA